MEVHALRERGWSISAIARHVGHDRKTVRAYLEGRRVPEQRVRREPTVAEPFLEYCRLRLAEDPHLWASTLLDELAKLGFTGSYPSLTAAIRAHGLRPHCEPCSASRGRDAALITHPAGEETQWDWLELPNPPSSWGVGANAHLLVGSLAHSGRWRAVLAESEDFPHLVEALDRVTRKLGGVSRRWRFDRMATVCSPATNTVSAAFAHVAKHYGVGVDLCPPRHGNRKGVVEKANHTAAQRWWRTVGDDTTVAAAETSLDELCDRLDGRARRRDGERTTVGALAAGEGLRAAPTAAYPAELTVVRTVSAQALVAFRGNRYSVPPGMPGAQVMLRRRLGADELRIVTAAGATVAVHHAAPDGAGAVVRDQGHVRALEARVLQAFSDARPCRAKTRRPAGEASRAEAARLRGAPATAATASARSSTSSAQRVVVDMATYAALVPAAARATSSSASAPVGGEVR
ncbi:Mu transposase domain-containing protein [Actinomycetospora soli]|uniref:Mu transposase domain-containing protein n=1 Tax=Actinomycetospora soli TaxID=2893887 RepID=UPI001E335FBC|nr:IS21 family transposase [Actinomycetospora soli]MCD2191101.1 IS21 family transposase [Actinomycetospora soli]